tara:strand:- start:127 stop:366 length:240 start_codon:yes stop_codon:yes gene_type:complete
MKILINNQEVDIATLSLEEVHSYDFPEFSDAFVSSGKFKNGKPLNGSDLQKLEETYPDLINQLAIENYWNGYSNKYHKN